MRDEQLASASGIILITEYPSLNSDLTTAGSYI